MYFISFEDYDKASNVSLPETSRSPTWVERFKRTINPSLLLSTNELAGKSDINSAETFEKKALDLVSDKDVLNHLNKIITSSTIQTSSGSASREAVTINHYIQVQSPSPNSSTSNIPNASNLQQQRASSRASVFLPEARKPIGPTSNGKQHDEPKRSYSQRKASFINDPSYVAPQPLELFQNEQNPRENVVLEPQIPGPLNKINFEDHHFLDKDHSPLFSKKFESFSNSKADDLLLNTSDIPKENMSETSFSPVFSNIFFSKNEPYQEFWMSDQTVKLCMRCERPFSTFWRKHHCRLCGKIFCSLCTQNYLPGHTLGSKNSQKICKDCYEEYQKSIQDKNSLYQRNNNRKIHDSKVSYSHSNSMSTSFVYSNNSPAKSIATTKPSTTERNATVNSTDMLNDREQTHKSVFNLLTGEKPKELAFSQDKLQESANSFNGPGGHENKSNSFYSAVVYNNDSVIPAISQKSHDEFPYAKNAIALAKAEHTCGVLDFKDMADGLAAEFGYFLTSECNIEPIRPEELEVDSQPAFFQSSAETSSDNSNDQLTSASLVSASYDFSLSSISTSVRQVNNQQVTSTLMFTENTLQHFYRMCVQLLKLEGIDNYDIWAKQLIEIVTSAVDKVRPAVDLGGSNDLGQYIKIKTISGGSINDSNYFSGVVFKNDFVHKRMPRELTDLRIMIITFPIVPNEPGNHYVSLNVSKEQEKEYIVKLVARILSSKPNLLLLEKGISRIALNILFENNVSVVIGMKRKVLQTIAFFTGTDIITSLDKLALYPSVGICKSMYTQSFVGSYDFAENTIPEIIKYIYLDGCNPERGGTVVLRGDSKPVLKSIKKVAKMLLSLGYSLAMETSLLIDQFGAVYDYKALGCQSNAFSEVRDPEIKSVLLKYTETTMTTSPFIELKLPFELYVMLDAEKKLAKLNENFKHLNLSCEDTSCTFVSSFASTQTDLDSNLPYLVLKMQKVTDESRTFQAYRSEAAPLEEKIRLGRRFLMENPFPPTLWENQTLILMHYVKQNKLLCNGKNKTCVEPKAHFIEYHCASDITLGQYLQELCFDLDMDCSGVKPCSEPLYHHTRSYVHGDAAVDVTMREYPCPIRGMSEVILMWAECNKCEAKSPYTSLSTETWHVSFGKYLEFFFNGDSVVSRTRSCKHSLYHDYTHVFAYKNMAVNVNYTKIKLYNISTPASPLKFTIETNIKLKKQEASDLERKIDEYFESLLNSLQGLLISAIPPYIQSAFEEIRQNLVKRALSENKYFKQMLTQTLENTNPANTLALIVIYEKVQQKVVEWDMQLSEFYGEFLKLKANSTHMNSKLKEKNAATSGLKKQNLFPNFYGDNSNALNAINPVHNHQGGRANRNSHLINEEKLEQFKNDLFAPIISEQLGMGCADSEDGLFIPLLGSSPDSATQASLVGANIDATYSKKRAHFRKLSIELMREDKNAEAQVKREVKRNKKAHHKHKNSIEFRTEQRTGSLAMNHHYDRRLVNSEHGQNRTLLKKRYNSESEMSVTPSFSAVKLYDKDPQFASRYRNGSHGNEVKRSKARRLATLKKLENTSNKEYNDFIDSSKPSNYQLAALSSPEPCQTIDSIKNHNSLRKFQISAHASSRISRYKPSGVNMPNISYVLSAEKGDALKNCFEKGNEVEKPSLVSRSQHVYDNKNTPTSKYIPKPKLESNSNLYSSKPQIPKIIRSNYKPNNTYKERTPSLSSKSIISSKNSLTKKSNRLNDQARTNLETLRRYTMSNSGKIDSFPPIFENLTHNSRLLVPLTIKTINLQSRELDISGTKKPPSSSSNKVHNKRVAQTKVSHLGSKYQNKGTNINSKKTNSKLGQQNFKPSAGTSSKSTQANKGNLVLKRQAFDNKEKPARGPKKPENSKIPKPTNLLGASKNNSFGLDYFQNLSSAYVNYRSKNDKQLLKDDGANNRLSSKLESSGQKPIPTLIAKTQPPPVRFSKLPVSISGDEYEKNRHRASLMPHTMAESYSASHGSPDSNSITNYSLASNGGSYNSFSKLSYKAHHDNDLGSIIEYSDSQNRKDKKHIGVSNLGLENYSSSQPASTDNPKVSPSFNRGNLSSMLQNSKASNSVFRADITNPLELKLLHSSRSDTNNDALPQSQRLNQSIEPKGLIHTLQTKLKPIHSTWSSLKTSLFGMNKEDKMALKTYDNKASVHTAENKLKAEAVKPATLENDKPDHTSFDQDMRIIETTNATLRDMPMSLGRHNKHFRHFSDVVSLSTSYNNFISELDNENSSNKHSANNSFYSGKDDKNYSLDHDRGYSAKPDGGKQNTGIEYSGNNKHSIKDESMKTNEPSLEKENKKLNLRFLRSTTGPIMYQSQLKNIMQQSGYNETSKYVHSPNASSVSDYVSDPSLSISGDYFQDGYLCSSLPFDKQRPVSVKSNTYILNKAEESSSSNSNSSMLTPFASPSSSESDEFFLNFYNNNIKSTNSDLKNLMNIMKTENETQTGSNPSAALEENASKHKYLDRPVIGTNKSILLLTQKSGFDLEDKTDSTHNDDLITGIDSILNRSGYKPNKAEEKNLMINKSSFPNSLTQSPTKNSESLSPESKDSHKNLNTIGSIMKSSQKPFGPAIQKKVRNSGEIFNEKEGENSTIKEQSKQSENISQFWKSFLSLLQVHENSGVLDIKLNLKYPLLPTDHVVKNCPVIIRETEPSSIISFILSSPNYQSQLEQFYSKYKSSFIEQSYANYGTQQVETQIDSSFQKPLAEKQNNINPLKKGEKSGHNSETEIPQLNSSNQNEIALLHLPGQHVEFGFVSGETYFNCKLYYIAQFDALRRMNLCELTFIESISRCTEYLATGGKSGSSFLKTKDDRYVIKQVSKIEMKAFIQFAPFYFQQMFRTYKNEMLTLLIKIFGLFKVSYKNKATKKNVKFNFIIMENLFFEKNITKAFDLKGSVRNRLVDEENTSNVLQDENLINWIQDSPIFVRVCAKKYLHDAIWNDTLFLSKMNVMDYSLLVGIDEENDELVVGILDYIRTFTWDKKLESWVKESVFRSQNGKEPTIISPRQYKNRFREAMENYFWMSTDNYD